MRKIVLITLTLLLMAGICSVAYAEPRGGEGKKGTEAVGKETAEAVGKETAETAKKAAEAVAEKAAEAVAEKAGEAVAEKAGEAAADAGSNAGLNASKGYEILNNLDTYIAKIKKFALGKIEQLDENTTAKKIDDDTFVLQVGDSEEREAVITIIVRKTEEGYLVYTMNTSKRGLVTTSNQLLINKGEYKLLNFDNRKIGNSDLSVEQLKKGKLPTRYIKSNTTPIPYSALVEGEVKEDGTINRKIKLYDKEGNFMYTVDAVYKGMKSGAVVLTKVGRDASGEIVFTNTSITSDSHMDQICTDVTAGKSYYLSADIKDSAIDIDSITLVTP